MAWTRSARLRSSKRALLDSPRCCLNAARSLMEKSVSFLSEFQTWLMKTLSSPKRPDVHASAAALTFRAKAARSKGGDGGAGGGEAGCGRAGDCEACPSIDSSTQCRSTASRHSASDSRRAPTCLEVRRSRVFFGGELGAP